MPIRSPRGRVAAYRWLWQWPLRSPVRLGLTAAAVIGASIAVSTAIDVVSGTPAPAPARTGSEVSSAPVPALAGRIATDRTGVPSAAPTVLPPVPELAPSTLPLSRAPAEALAVAARWSAAWVNHPEGVTTQEWLAGLRPHTTEEYLGVLAGVDPANVPAARVTGEPAPVRVAVRSVQVEVPTDALTLVVLVVDTDEGWRVAGYDRA